MWCMTPDRPHPPRELAYLPPATWREIERLHHREVDALVADHRLRAGQNRSHPVEDFLFTYYSQRPAQLRRWHAGARIGLVEADERREWRFHRSLPLPIGAGSVVVVDQRGFLQARSRSVRFIRQLLGRTAAAVPQFGCFGLHEWAMVFESDDHRHTGWPLRLGPTGTDDVVRQHQIRCSHFDAYRFFTPTAKPRNLLAPDLWTRDEMEQPGCLHASMDLYKWAFRLVPVVSSDLLLRCFRLARQIREVDMRASPYDLSQLGYRPIAIETPTGKAEYVSHQRDFAARGQHLRAEMIKVLDDAFAGPDGEWPDLDGTPELDGSQPADHRSLRGSSGARQQNSR